MKVFSFATANYFEALCHLYFLTLLGNDRLVLTGLINSCSENNQEINEIQDKYAQL